MSYDHATKAINIFCNNCTLKIKTNIEVYIQQAEVGVITAGTKRKETARYKVVGGLRGRGMHTFCMIITIMKSFHAPSWPSESQVDKKPWLMRHTGKNANGLTGTL